MLGEISANSVFAGLALIGIERILVSLQRSERLLREVKGLLEGDGGYELYGEEGHEPIPIDFDEEE